MGTPNNEVRDQKSDFVLACLGQHLLFRMFLENQTAPQAGFWDRIPSVSGAPGIHFEDYPELSGFDCPEWSHLTAKDATRFTRSLLPILSNVL